MTSTFLGRTGWSLLLSLLREHCLGKRSWNISVFSLNKQKQSLRDVPRKRYSENMQQIYRETPMPKCDFNKVALQIYSNFIEIALRHGCSSVNALHIFRTPFLKNSSGWLLLNKYFSFFFSVFIFVYDKFAIMQRYQRWNTRYLCII